VNGDNTTHRLAVTGGICGASGTLLYIAGAFLPLGEKTGYAVVMFWPILSIVFVYGIFRLIGAGRESVCNHLAFLFACLAFATVASMISVQLALRIGIAQYAGTAPAADGALYDTILKSGRLVDQGMDVAWDFLIGTSLIFLSAALGGDARFGKVWGAIAALLGAGLIVLNAVAFPWPPADAGLFDLGPLIGVFIVALSVRMVVVGMRGLRTSPV
jgi:hypothetical protein